MHYYLIALDFNCGELGLPFYHTIAARSIEGAQNRIHRYFRGFYGRQESRTIAPARSYEYLSGQVTVDVTSIDEYPTRKEAERALFEALKI